MSVFRKHESIVDRAASDRSRHKKKIEKAIKEIKDELNLKEKNPYNEILIEKDLDKILNIFRTSGFYFAEVDVSVENNNNNTINIIFNIFFCNNIYSPSKCILSVYSS